MALAPQSKQAARARRMIAAAKQEAKAFDNPMFGEMYVHAVEQKLAGNGDFLRFIKGLKEPPVDIETFLDHEDFMGATDLKLWPVVRETIVAANKYWWKGVAHGAYQEILCTGATGTGKCISGNSEYLSPTGWRRLDEYDGGLVGQAHADGTVEMVQPLAYIDQPNTTGFLKIENTTFSLEATPNHRVPHFDTKTGQFRNLALGDIQDTHDRTRYGFKGRIPATFTVEGRPGLLLTDDEIRLMVAVMADGSFYEREGHHTTYCVHHVKREAKKERLRQLLDSCGIEYNDYARGDGFSDIAFRAPQRNKTYEGWWVANQHQLQVIRDEVLFWDGSTGKCDRFSTCDKHTADFIQYVGSATGSKTSINIYDRVGEMCGEYERKSVEYTVIFQKVNSHGIGKGSGDKPEFVETQHDREYCFTVPTGLFLLRQNGHVSVTGNSEMCKVSIAYLLHILGCMKAPQTFFDLPSSTSIVIPIQAAKPHVTKKVIYMPLRSYIEGMPWFQRNMRPDRLIEAEMYFVDLNIRVVQGGADSDAILGDAVIAGIVDEINFMNVVQKSKRADVASGGRSGSYDQAQNVYEAMIRRRKSRFITRGPQLGQICISSSRRYKNDFTDRRQQQVENGTERGVLVYDKAQYEAQPAARYCGDKFRVVIMNSASMDIRILDDEDPDPRGAEVFHVPVEYRDEFIKSPAGSVRDVIGRSVNSISPFFRKRNSLDAAVMRGQDKGLQSILVKDNVILGIEGMPVVIRGTYCKNPSQPRYVHIDLSATGDRCGISMVRFDGMVSKTRNTGETEMLPKATVEVAVSIEPDHGAEIDLAEVRSWVKQLRDVYGYPIRAVSYDGWSSLESRQQWKKAGMKTGLVSVDRTTGPYKNLRDAYSDERIDMFPQEMLMTELYELEFDGKIGKDGKIDHPPQGSKDIADAVCGAYYTLLTRATTWMDQSDDDNGTKYRADTEEVERFIADRQD